MDGQCALAVDLLGSFFMFRSFSTRLFACSEWSESVFRNLAKRRADHDERHIGASTDDQEHNVRSFPRRVERRSKQVARVGSVKYRQSRLTYECAEDGGVVTGILARSWEEGLLRF